MTQKHATYYTDAETRQSLIDIGMKAGAKEGRAASLGLRISAAYHERLVEALRDMIDYNIPQDEECKRVEDRASALLEEIEGSKK